MIESNENINIAYVICIINVYRLAKIWMFWHESHQKKVDC